MQKKIRFISVLLSFLLLFSCASEKPMDKVLIVDFAGDEAREKITISDKALPDYGPSPETQADVNNAGDAKQSGQTVVALDLLPALYNSIAYVSTFSELEKAGVDVSIISASGFSSIIAALYAKHGAANMVEWKTFKLYQSLGSIKPFTEEWKEIIADFLKVEFGNQRLSQLKKLLLIPANDKNKVVLGSDRNLIQAIMESLDLSGKNSILLGSDFNYLPRLKEYGADYFYRLSFLPERINLKHADGFTFGIYSRLAGRSAQVKGQKNTYIFNQALSGDIDSFNNLSDTIYQTRDENRSFAAAVADEISDIEEISGKNVE